MWVGELTHVVDKLPAFFQTEWIATLVPKLTSHRVLVWFLVKK